MELYYKLKNQLQSFLFILSPFTMPAQKQQEISAHYHWVGYINRKEHNNDQTTCNQEDARKQRDKIN